MKRNKNLNLLLGIIILISVVSVVFNSGCGTGAKQSKKIQTRKAGNSTLSRNDSENAGIITPNAGFNMYVESVQKGLEPPTQTPSVSKEEAEKKVGIKLKLPRETLGGKITGIYTDTTADGHPEACLHYISGFCIGEEVLKDKPDYRARIAADAEDRRTASIYIGAEYHIVSVAEHEGIEKPQYEFTGYDGKNYKLPPDLYWWENGVQYSIIPYKLGFTEDQLKKVAESMYK